MNRLIAWLYGLHVLALHWRGEQKEAACVHDGDDNRLRLIYVADGPIGRKLRRTYASSDGRRMPRGWDFHSLIWEGRSGSAWRAKRCIDGVEFQAQLDRRRWVSDLHSLDASTGTAIVRVAQSHQPRSAGSYNVGYSWRLLDLERCDVSRVLEHCIVPSAPYSGAQEADGLTQ